MKLLATTATAAAVVGAGQLGMAYGLGIVRLDRVLDVTARDQWTAQLAWVAWITMSAAAIGAIVATALGARWRTRPVGAGGALSIGIAAGLGSLAVLPLTMQPARSAQVAGVQPVFVIGVAAGLGAAAGVFAAWAVAAKPAARWNAAALSVLMWIVALVSIVPSLLPGHTPIGIRLGVLSGSLVPPAVAAHTALLTMPVLSLLAGLATGWVARGRRLPVLAAGLAGLTGPALLTAAYLVAGPEAGAAGFQHDPYWSAMTACGAGVLGSVLAAVPGQVPSEKARPEPESGPESGPAAPPAAPPAVPPAVPPAAPPAVPAPPLPKRDVPVRSAIAQAAAAAAQRPEDQLRPSDTGVIPAAGTPNNPFAGGTGSPFRSGVPFPPQPTPTQAPPKAPAPENPPRFSGQRPKAAPGWGGRRSPAPAAPPQQAPGGDSFNGFNAVHTGSVTAEQSRVTAPRGPVVEPTSISGPHRPAQETDYVDWVSGLGGQ
ncbi:hypothetical protein Asi03nite_37210 [Actinoplanes siamensis]|uniref:Uncharacterized protein n=1 Tax=Actinoplanes siamensis TaxID=1223317 RepID=A0A919N884_9ACTN|nr:hypothetical protein Asi03nite_37210 [Actinoplanes siamensis]